MYTYICPRCGLYLDPGEKCDCIERLKIIESMLEEDEEGQLTMKEAVDYGKHTRI